MPSLPSGRAGVSPGLEGMRSKEVRGKRRVYSRWGPEWELEIQTLKPKGCESGH